MPALGQAATQIEIQADNPDLRQYLLDAFAQTSPQLEQWTGVTLPRITVRVPANAASFAREMEALRAPLWAAGLALPQQNLIIIRSPKEHLEPALFRRTFVHELIHLYLDQALGEKKAPIWLHEGLAMYASGEGGVGLAATMAQGVLQKKLFYFDQLDNSFPAASSQSSLAYAQSYYFVVYLNDHFGPEAINHIIIGLSQGRHLSQVLKEATGQGLYGLTQDFYAEMERRFSWLALLSAGTLLWGIISLLMAIGLVRRRREHKRRMGLMDDVDEPGLPETDPDKSDKAPALVRPRPLRKSRQKALTQAGLHDQGAARSCSDEPAD